MAGGKGGGVNASMQAMAAARAAESQKVVDALEKLSATLQAAGSAGGGGGGSGGVGGGAGGGPGGAGPRGAGGGSSRGGTAADRDEFRAYAMNEKMGSAKGDGDDPLRDATKAVLTGAGLGNFTANPIAATVSAGVQEFKDQRDQSKSIAQAGGQAYAGAPVNSSEAYKRSLEREAAEIKELNTNSERAGEFSFSRNQWGDWSDKQIKEREQIRSRNEADIRFRGARERVREEGARGALTQDFEGFAKLGMRVPENLLRFMTKLRQKQADSRQAIQEQISAQPGFGKR